MIKQNSLLWGNMKYLRNIKVKVMMLAVLIVFTALWGGVSFFSLHALNALREEVDLTNVQQMNSDIINGASDTYYQIKLAMDRAMVDQAAGDTQHYQKMLGQINAHITFLQGGLDKFKVTNHANISSGSIDKIYTSSLTLFTQAIVPMFEAVKANNKQAYTDRVEQHYFSQRIDFTRSITAYNEEINDLKATANDRISHWVSLAKLIIIMAMVGGVLILLLTERYLTLFMARPLNWVKQHLQVLSEGHLDKDTIALGNNEAGQLLPLLDIMQANWVKTVSQIRRSAEEIHQGSSEIAAGNIDLSSRTEEQAAALTQTAASMEELSAAVRQNADNAAKASVLAQTTSSAANDGSEVVQTVIGSMQSITGSSRKISDIISVIDSIAFQTNILALNAAVEAARAGEQGRGFAVVASEVRNLAQRSAASAREIKALIDESVANVDNGYRQVSLTSDSMDNILKSVTSVTAIMGEIALASSEQSKGIAQVGTAISQMDVVTQQNAALVEESSATSTLLEEQARHLTGIVSIFKLPADAFAARANGRASL